MPSFSVAFALDDHLVWVVSEAVAVEGDLGLSIDALQHLIVVDFGILQPTRQRPLAVGLDHIQEQQFQKFQVGEFAGPVVGTRSGRMDKRGERRRALSKCLSSAAFSKGRFSRQGTSDQKWSKKP